MSKTLVTGATGLVGFNIVEALRRRGAAVRCLARGEGHARLADDAVRRGGPEDDGILGTGMMLASETCAQSAGAAPRRLC